MDKFLAYLERNSYVAHILFWVSIFLIQTFATGDMNGTFSKRAIHYGFGLIPRILAGYLLVYYLVPKLLFKKKYIKFAILFIVSAYLICTSARIIVVYIVEEFTRAKPFHQEPILEIYTDIRHLYFSYFFGIYYPAFAMLMLVLFKEFFEKRSVVEKLEREKVSAELSFLKSQIHPHFLFNTLNNLYVLTLKKSDKAPETVLKLSEILDYMIYQCNDAEISIEKEIQLIKNYVALEELRYGKKLDLNLQIDIDNPHTKITPLLLISIVENAFKHGVVGSVSTAKVTINIKVENHQLYCKVFNTKPEFKQNDEMNFKEGIGLTNTKKQLALVYPEKNELLIEQAKDSYTVVLTIDLNK